MINLNQN